MLLQQKRDYSASLAHALRVPSESQNSAQVLAVLCGDYAALGDRDNAAKTADRLARSPELSESDIKQIIPSLEISKRYDVLIALIEALRTRQTLSTEMLHTLGLAYERAERLPEARAALEQYATGRNLSITSLLELTRIAYKQKDYRGALGYLAHAQDLDPNNASLHYYFGYVCLDLNLIAEARNSFEKAVKLESENPQYNYAMGAASAFRHDPAEAVPYFEKYLKLKPEDSRGKLALGAAFFRAKDYQAAQPWLNEAVKISATATPAHYYLGCIALQERRLDEARVQLSQALAIRPDYADALAELGQYYLLQKDYGEAEKQIRRALEIDADHYAANFYLLNLYTRTADPRRESQAKRFEELEKLLDERTREFLRIVEVRPFEAP
jgi:tetratricopeptide (TPR) repeat protein